jgi:hypothetical protein
MPLGIRFSRRGESQERNVETLVRLSFKTGAASVHLFLEQIVDSREFPLLSLLHVMVLGPHLLAFVHGV